jgi:hypothetical protein
MLENIGATNEEGWIVRILAERIRAKKGGFLNGPCANDVLNAFLPLSDPWSADPEILKRHCQLLSCASTLVKEG